MIIFSGLCVSGVPGFAGFIRSPSGMTPVLPFPINESVCPLVPKVRSKRLVNHFKCAPKTKVGFAKPLFIGPDNKPYRSVSQSILDCETVRAEPSDCT